MHYRWHYYDLAPFIPFHLHHFMYYLSSSHLGDFRVSLLWHDAHFYNDFRCGLVAASLIGMRVIVVIGLDPKICGVDRLFASLSCRNNTITKKKQEESVVP